MAERRTLTIGGEGSSLTSASVISIANNLSQIQIDSVTLEKLSSSSSNSTANQTYRINLPETLTIQEQRASLVVILNKLLLPSNGGGIRPNLPTLITKILNDSNLASSISSIPLLLTPQELTFMHSCLDNLDGICALIDHETRSLLNVVDSIASLSCEATGAKYKSAFSDLDSTDADVASDVMWLLKSSRLAEQNDVGFVSCIPPVHGRLREEVKKFSSRTRINMNCSRFSKESWIDSLSALVFAMARLGKSSLSRAQAMAEENNNAHNVVSDAYKAICDACESDEYGVFLHLAYEFVGLVRNIVSWEMEMAVMLLESQEINGLGNGTRAIMKLIQERMECNSMEKLSARKYPEFFESMLDPKDKDFDEFVCRIREALERKEKRRLPKIPKGTRDFAKEKMVVRESGFKKITEVFKRHGAMPLDTPVFELKETLMGKYGEDSKLIYDLADQGGELCSLRYDLTVPFARYMAMNKLKSYKRYQIAKVYRRDNTSKGRYREFYQCDFDIAGDHGKMAADFEVIKILTELLDELSIGDYKIKLNHRKLLDGMMFICGVPRENFRTICSSIDKLDKLSSDQVKNEMVNEKGLEMEVADKVMEFVKQKGSPLVLLSKLKQDEKNKSLCNQECITAFSDLEILFKALDKSKCLQRVVFDLSLARGLDYYTGVIFEAVFTGTTKIGSIAAGGRYDDLISMFNGGDLVPAVGVSLGIERVFDIMEEQINLDNTKMIRENETEVLVIVIGDDVSKAADLVSELWNAKIKAEFLLLKRIRKENIERALKQKIPLMVIVGEDEMKNGVVKLKDLDNNKQEIVSRKLMVNEIKKKQSKKGECNIIE